METCADIVVVVVVALIGAEVVDVVDFSVVASATECQLPPAVSLMLLLHCFNRPILSKHIAVVAAIAGQSHEAVDDGVFVVVIDAASATVAYCF